MTNNRISKALIGIALTLAVYAVALVSSRLWQPNCAFIPDSFMTHAVMLVLSVGLIISLKKQVNYHIALPKFKLAIKPILFGFVSAVAINFILGILAFFISGTAEAHPLLEKTTALQNFLFVFLFASIAEEHLFRGFFQNYLRPLKDIGLTLLGKRISLPVFIAALAFSLAHLILLTSGVGVLFIVRILVFTFVLGLIAGYYQEKHNNIAYAILVHMAGNLMGLVSAIVS